jgi:two-component system response regulator RegA
VHLLHDGDSALRWLDRVRPTHAVVDLRLPDMSGLRVVQRLRERAAANVVVLTGYGSIATAIEAIKLGATYYLTKPVQADQVLQAFEQTEANPDLPPASRPLSVERLAWEHIQDVLTRFGGNVSAAARELNMHRRTLQRKLAKSPPRK